jgi:hypothetical protein
MNQLQTGVIEEKTVTISAVLKATLLFVVKARMNVLWQEVILCAGNVEQACEPGAEARPWLAALLFLRAITGPYLESCCSPFRG